MHEMSIAQSLFEIINEEIRKNRFSRITAVRMKIGEMTAVVPESLEFCFEVLARGTPVEGADLEMTVVPVTGRCGSCGDEFAVENYCFECPGCKSVEINLIAGEELRIYELEGE